jgi:hypothetical protein
LVVCYAQELRRRSLEASGIPALTALLAASIATSGCEKSGTIPNTYVPPDASIGVAACVFDELDTFTCPNLTLAPPAWVPKCVDGDDCSRRVTGTTQTGGCTQATTYQNVLSIVGSCASWRADGGALPVVDSGPPPVCAPGSVASFTPKWHPPRAKTTSCTRAQIEAYLQCLSDATTALSPPSCAEWSGTISASDQTCLTCLSSNESDSTYGPFVSLPGVLLVNVAGCIALAEGKTDGSGCGGALQQDEQCQRAACLPTCSIVSHPTDEANCETEANALPGDAGGGGACAKFVPPAECAGAIEQTDAGTPAEKACFGGSAAGGASQFEAVALAFCGP